MVMIFYSYRRNDVVAFYIEEALCRGALKVFVEHA